ncbi:unnamed protein product (macronuclear) [Paramecium tetraurelia]|uniref:Uncharacterized protein n=1 Tax=Paramecium tetraurelia TaxID=5888 RepID=A0C7H6_PARTE|nr:uncharacterized protein GSPATT00035873001 [Paramecium tetraurelia]CAK66743.1 unnamed protein product [Paramecium tetraurelia]|eukprot:XP_001434140.1 hypothetical protein (macronuclear) [Paramecium tetraurelia strain d4-2]
MNRSSHKRQRTSNTPKRQKEQDNNPIPSQQVAKQVRNDEAVQQLSVMENPKNQLRRQDSQNFHLRSSQHLEKSYNLTDRIFSPARKQDQSPNLRKKENIKIIDSYEARYGKLSTENLQLQNQIQADQQKYNKIINELEIQLSNQTYKLQTEQHNIKQQQLLLQKKNEEIQLLVNELKKNETKFIQISQNNVQSVDENQNLKAYIQNLEYELQNLKQQVQDTHFKSARQIEETKIKVENDCSHQSQIQLKDIQQQHQQILSKKNDQLIQEQQKYSKLLGQFDNLVNEKNKMQLLIDDLQDEKLVIQQQLQQQNQMCEEFRLKNMSLHKEVQLVHDKQAKQELSHQKQIQELKQYYEQQQINNLQRRLNETELKHSTENQQQDQIIRELQAQLQQSENNYQVMKTENAKLYAIDQEQEKEIKILQQELERINKFKDLEIQQQQEDLQKLKQQLLEQSSKYQTKLHELSKQQVIANDIKSELELQKNVTKEIEASIREQWETDIQELKGFNQQQLQNLEEQIKFLNLENEKLIIQSRKKDEQINEYKLNQQLLDNSINGLKHQLSDTEKQKQKELEDYQFELENFKKELKEQNVKLQQEKQLMEQQLKQQKQRAKELETAKIELEFSSSQQIQNYQEQIKQKDWQISQFNSEKQKFESLLKSNKERLTQAEFQVVELKQSADIYLKELEESTQQRDLERSQFNQKFGFQETRISQYKQAINQYEIEIHNQNNQIDKAQKSLDHAMLESQKKIEESRKREQKLLDQIANLNLQLQSNEDQFIKYQEEHKESNKQIEQLLQEKDSLIKSLENQKEKLVEVKNELTEEIEQLNQKIQNYAEGENQRQDWEFQVENEKAVLNNEIEILQQKLDQKESKLNQIQQQFSNLEIQLQDKEVLYDSLRRQIDQNYVHVEDYEQLKQKNINLLNEIHELESSQLKSNSEKQSLRRQVEKLKSDLELKEQEFEQTFEQLNKRRGDNEDVAKLTKEIQRLNFELSDAQTLLQAKSEQLNIMRRENDDQLEQLNRMKRQLNQTSEKELIRRIDKSEHLEENL